MGQHSHLGRSSERAGGEWAQARSDQAQASQAAVALGGRGSVGLVGAMWDRVDNTLLALKQQLETGRK